MAATPQILCPFFAYRQKAMYFVSAVTEVAILVFYEMYFETYNGAWTMVAERIEKVL